MVSLTQQRFHMSWGLSIAVHLIIAMGVLWQVTTHTSLTKKSEQRLTISLGLQAALAGANHTVAHTAQQSAKQVHPKEKPIKPIKERVTPQPEKKIEPPKIVKHAVVKKNQQPPKEQEKVVKKVPHKKPEHKVVKVQTSQRAIAQRATKETQSGLKGTNGSKKSVDMRKETGTANSAAVANTEQQYDYLVRQHLLSHKRTPKLLNSGRTRGAVTLHFILNKEGKVIKAEITNPSRIKAFNKAAVKMLAHANPFPKAPSEVTWSQRDFRIVITYDIR